VWSGDPSLLSSVPGRPRGKDGGKGWNLGGLKALLPRASGERWPIRICMAGYGSWDSVFAWLTGALGL
jgi:hypothetical protein